MEGRPPAAGTRVFGEACVVATPTLPNLQRVVALLSGARLHPHVEPADYGAWPWAGLPPMSYRVSVPPPEARAARDLLASDRTAGFEARRREARPVIRALVLGTLAVLACLAVSLPGTVRDGESAGTFQEVALTLAGLAAIAVVLRGGRRSVRESRRTAAGAAAATGHGTDGEAGPGADLGAGRGAGRGAG